MTGQIPNYSKGRLIPLERVSVPFHTRFSRTIYRAKQDPTWWIRSNRTSEKWWIFKAAYHEDDGIIIAGPDDTLGEAMIRLEDGMDYGFYAIKEKS